MIGIAGAVPAALTGASDWRDLMGESRRIATLHGLLNSVGLTLTSRHWPIAVRTSVQRVAR